MADARGFVRLLLVAILTLVCAVTTARANPRQPTVEEGRHLLSLISGVGHFRLTEVRYDGYWLGLVDANGQHLGMLTVTKAGSGDSVPRMRSRSFTYHIGNTSPDFAVINTLVRAAGVIAEADGGKLPDEPVRMRRSRLDELIWVTVVVGIIAILLGLWRREVVIDIRKPHVVQILAQSSVYVYWWIYFPGVWYHLPSIAVQLVLAYAADAAFCFARFGSWRLGLSPVPVILSTNLFEWFDGRGLILAILLAFGSKALIHRGPRHIFNPSVAGLSAVGVITVFVPDFVHFGSAFHTLNIPPNMAEWVLLAALLPQTQFRILPVSIGATVCLWLTGNPAVVRPAIILAFTLLASDPATTPRGDIGKFLFGAVIGFGLPMFSVVMRYLGHPDDFAKIFPVAVANLLVPWLDVAGAVIVSAMVSLRAAIGNFISRNWAAVASRWGTLASTVFQPVPNMSFVACWLLLCFVLLLEEKPRDFEPAFHWNWDTPLIVRDADDVLRCESNPIFCKPFMFVQEAGLWRDRVLTPRPAAAEVSNAP